LIEPGDPRPGISEERERESVPGLKPGMPLRTRRVHSEDECVARRHQRSLVTELAELVCTDWGLVRRIKDQDYILAAKFGEGHFSATLVGECEVRSKCAH
jgi:hypothetical protein